jgi:hypothetical protein
MRTVDGLTFISVLDLNMGFWTTLLDKESQHYKRQHKNYGHLPTKIQHDIEPWDEVHVNLIGPWMIPQRPSKNPNLSAKPDMKQPQIPAVTMIDPSTHLLELTVVPDKESRTVARAFDRSWLCCYPRPLICLHDKGTEFTGIDFQELLQSYGIKAVIATTANPQTNAILERTHQEVIANQLLSLRLISIKLNSLADIQHELLAPVQWAMNSTYHTTLQATSAQLAFHRDMVMPTSFMAHWQSIRQRCQAITDRDNSVGDLILIRQDTSSKLAKPTCGLYRLIDVACQHVNGTVVVDLNHSHKMFNIRQLIPFKPCQNNGGRNLSYHVPHQKENKMW